MGSHWLAGPDRTDFFRRVVANCEDEIELGRIRMRELVPRLRSPAGSLPALKALNLPAPRRRIQDNLGHLGPRRVTVKEKHV